MKRLFRNFLLAGLIALAVNAFTVGVLSPHLSRTVGQPDVRETRSFNLAEVQNVHLANSNGRIQVRVHETCGIRLDAEITAYIYSPLSKGTLDSLVNVEQSDTTLDITSQLSSATGLTDLRIDYTLMVPPTTNIAIQSVNGNVRVSKGCGQVTVDGQNADIEIVEPQRAVSASTTNGRIRLLDAPAGATLRTVNGSIYAHVLGGVLEAATTNGAVVAHMLKPDIEQCRLDSKNGGITLVLYDEGSAEVEAITARGAIRCDWPIAGMHDDIRELRGTIGQGHTSVHMNTLNGNIWLAKGSK